MQLGEYLSEPKDRHVNNQAIEELRGTQFENSVVELNKLFKRPAHRRVALAKRMKQKGVRAVNTADFLDQRDELLKNPAAYEFSPDNLKYCDFREFLANIPDNEARFIISDIPYDNDHAWILEPLAKEAKRVLKAGGYLITMVGQWNKVFPQAVKAFTQYLDWCGMIGCFYSGNTAKVHGHNVAASWKPMLVLKNGAAVDKSDLHDSLFFRDSVNSPMNEKLYHPHQQGVEEFTHVLKALSLPGDLVVDPFMGSGTIGVAALRCGCRFMGCDDGSCGDDGKYDGPGVGDKWIKIAQLRLDDELKLLKKTGKPEPQLKEPQSIISAELLILGAA